MRDRGQIIHFMQKLEVEYAYLFRDFLADLKEVNNVEKWKDLEFALDFLVNRKVRLTQLRQQIDLLKWVIEEDG